MEKEKIIFSWSSGKDSSLCLYEVMKSGKYEVVSLLTTISEDYDRISMHGVPRVLLERQAESIGLPLNKIFISPCPDNSEYEAKMEEFLLSYKEKGVETVAFGDIFLDSLRKYREEKLAVVDMKALFPLWKRNTVDITRKFIDLGFKTITTCVDSNLLDKSFVGRIIDDNFLGELPENVDPCGENGEYHSFAFDGPIFRESIGFKTGEIVLRDGFYYCDLIPE
ncbi:MAG: ATP-binding protein [Candidatus Melainabacteria bacterium RIFOXYA12_FULL_32_12]|nr:MAG: ATP-binding protein [Candidatus Melainabacteria bacterium RIFOXYA12_FULL_32_12]